MLKRFIEEKLAPVLHNGYQRLNTQPFQRFLIALTVLIVSPIVMWSAWRHVDIQKELSQEECSTLYAQALETLSIQGNIYYRIEGTVSSSVGTTTYEEKIIQFITLEAYGTEQARISVEETREIGDYEITRFDFYADGKEYLSIQGAAFQAEVLPDEFSRKFTPYALITPEHYAGISGIATKDRAQINFTDPLSPEIWLENGISLISAEGSAQFNETRNLISSTFSTRYTLGDMVVTAQYTATIIDTDVAAIQLPDPSNYTPIANIDIPYLLETTCGYLMSAKNIQTEYKDTIACEAFGDVRTQSFQMNISAYDGWSALVDTSVSVSNSSKAGAATTVKSEQFSNNIYSSSIDGGAYTENPDVDQNTMRSYCESLLIGTIILPQYVASVDLDETDEYYTISIQATDEFAQILAEEACTTLYQSATILKDITEVSTIDMMDCYLTIDKHTGLPVSSGFHYQGTYTISELPYKLSFQADQTYTATFQ